MISGKYCSLSNYYNNVQLKRPFCYCYYLDNVQSHSPAVVLTQLAHSLCLLCGSISVSHHKILGSPKTSHIIPTAFYVGGICHRAFGEITHLAVFLGGDSAFATALLPHHSLFCRLLLLLFLNIYF